MKTMIKFLKLRWFFSFAILLIFSNCDTNTENNPTDSRADAANILQASVDNSSTSIAKSQPLFDKKTLHTVHDLIIKDCSQFEDLYKKEHLFFRYFDEEEAHGEAYFYNGKISRVSWSEEDVGQNGQYICYFDEKGNVSQVESFFHNGRDFTSRYFRNWEEKVITFAYAGIFEAVKKAPYELAYFEEDNDLISIDEYRTLCLKAQRLLATTLNTNKATTGTRYYKGTIDNQYPIEVKLYLSDNFAHGQYHYEKSERALKIVGNVKDGVLNLKEKNEKTDKITGRFEGVLSFEGNIKGTWFNADDSKELPFELTLSDTYTTIEGSVLKSLPYIIPELFHQNIKTNYFDLPDDYRETAKELLGSSDIETLSINETGISKIKEFLYDNFILNPEFEDDNFYDDYGSAPVLQYFIKVYTRLPDFVSAKERHDGYYRHMAKEVPIKQRLLSYLAYRIDRSPENIAIFWNLYKSEIYRLIDSDAYEHFEIDQMVNDLTNSFEHLSTVEDFEVQLDSVYQAVEKLNQQKLDPTYTSGAYGVGHDLQYAFFKSMMLEDSASYHRKLWAYSFWMRRNHEGNLEKVGAILKEMKNHYSSN